MAAPPFFTILAARLLQFNCCFMINDGLKNTEEKVFQSLIDTYQRRLYGYIFTITHSHYAAEELSQEIFIKLWLCRDLLPQIDNPEGYIFTIAKNKTLNYLRKAANDSRLLRELQSHMEPDSNNAEERVITAEYDKLLQEALTMLSPQRRLVYTLSRRQGLNHEQIAGRLSLSRNTVKNHLVEALRFIRHYLGKRGIATVWLMPFLIG